MIRLSDYPISTAVISFLVLCLAVWGGALIRAWRGQEELKETREDFDMVVAASLTLLGLIIGFSFSMATSRYDQRKDLEEAEANAIGGKSRRSKPKVQICKNNSGRPSKGSRPRNRPSFSGWHCPA